MNTCRNTTYYSIFKNTQIPSATNTSLTVTGKREEKAEHF